MYFQIENTPENIRRARRVQTVQSRSPKEECPRLVLAPFSKPPQVVFENVVIGTSCERTLEVFNPSKQEQKITLSRSLPSGLIIQLPDPGGWLILEAETCYSLTLLWTPTQPTALRDTIRFTDEKRGRYDVIVVLKTGMDVKVRGTYAKGSKISPGKIKKKQQLKKSPVFKKKAEIIYNATKIKKTVNIYQTIQHHVLQPSSKDNILTTNDYTSNSQTEKCPFDSPTNIDFNTSEIFSNLRMHRTNKELKYGEVMQKTYDKTYNDISQMENVPQPNKKTCNMSGSDLFDNLTFTPLKVLPNKNDHLDKGPKIILSLNSESDFDDMNGSNKENETHSIISITSSQPPNRILSVNYLTQLDRDYIQTPIIQNKKIPNTSSPKELNSPNFSINTELSRISDLSFFPQRFSTERKVLPKIDNDTHVLTDEVNLKLSSDTYTKESPETPLNFQMYSLESKPPNYFFREQQPKMCRQSLFREYQQLRDIRDKNFLHPESLSRQPEIKSPLRSITPPPLQSIPEESGHQSDTNLFDKTNRQSTFTINRTIDKDYHDMSVNNRRLTWSKKSFRAEPELWKVPTAVARKSKPKPSLTGKESLGITNTTFEKSIYTNTSITNHIPNVYSQSSTADPFLSTTYFYDEEAVHKIEVEFKRWLNCILTPPADLDSNVEQKIDVGKAWLENRNKDVPLAPTKEQVCSIYHNSHRLECLRRAARTLLKSPEMTLVFQKLNAQIEKKLIAIRTDRNLHLDIGLQKCIMELLLSYNPLWLRIGLEVIYGVILPLKSNSDIEGLTTFIVQRMFKNPHLKGKHSKSNVPNMLSPAYMEAIKKFTLKKFFMLVYFLDQAKQRKIISHDPCLFCRNAICKESREIIIRFTRELIAGIGDITKHLRPLGYVVCHKQSYLDEYKYAVNNIAVDLRDGVRLTKVMEIILMKTGLLHQLRAPAISRLQKIHNVQIALNALKEANFSIVGEITPNDISDGHREKTLSLLWQLIHVFRAPLFEKAANVIQMWWKKKYEIILQKRIKEEKLRQELENSAMKIQRWWRRIQYDRLVEWQMQQVTSATIIIQKYCRKWLLRGQYRKMRSSVTKIQRWYLSMKMIQEAKHMLGTLKEEKAKLQNKSALIIQSYVRRWLCINQYKTTLNKIVLIQSIIRSFIVRKKFILLKKSTILFQRKYRANLLMKANMKDFAQKRNSALVLQKYIRMFIERRKYEELKKSAIVIQNRYRAIIKMKQTRTEYLALQNSIITIQSLYRARKARENYCKQRHLIIQLQRRVKAHQSMKIERTNFLKIRIAAIVIQRRLKAYLLMKIARDSYIFKRKASIVIQNYYRFYLIMKTQRALYLKTRTATLVLQRRYRSLILMRSEKADFLKKKSAIVCIQRRYRANLLMKQTQKSYQLLRSCAIILQRRFRALIQMRKERTMYLQSKSACISIQIYLRAILAGRRQRQQYLDIKRASIKIQDWYRNCRKAKLMAQQYQKVKKSSLIIQRTFRAYIIGHKQRQEFLRIKTATVHIQIYYRSYIEMKRTRQQYLRLKTATITIQRYYKSYIETKKQRQEFLKVKASVVKIENYFIQYRESKRIRREFCSLRDATISIQTRYRGLCVMRRERKQYLEYIKSVTIVQRKFRALLLMRKERVIYRKLRNSAIVIQRRYRAKTLMIIERNNYIATLSACKLIQAYYRAYKVGQFQCEDYQKLKQSCLVLQRRYRSLLLMRSERNNYLKIKSATLTIQNRFRAHCLMLIQRSEYLKTLKAIVAIQRQYRALRIGKKQRREYLEMKSAAIVIQRYYMNIRETRAIRNDYLRLKNTVINIQRRFRVNIIAREVHKNQTASKIQIWFRSIQQRNICRREFLRLRNYAVKIQNYFRMYILRRKFLTLKMAIITIQKFYRCRKLTILTRKEYVQKRNSIIKLQTYVRCYKARTNFMRLKRAALTIQAAYRCKRLQDEIKAKKVAAATCIQRYVRRYLVQSRYRLYRQKVMLVQQMWKGKLVTRLLRYEFLQKRMIIIRLQSVVRGYLVRKQIMYKKEQLLKIKEEKRQYWAASKIQAIFRGHRVRVAAEKRVSELRRRWRDGALESTQETLKERNEEAMDVLRNMSDIETVIRAFRSLELLTETFPKMYHELASSIVHRVYVYMSLTNRSISSIQVLKSAASILVNLTRYRTTGPKLYARERIPPILKFMWRFSNSETELFCILSTYIWLFSKYDGIREDLTELLHMPENHKMLTSIKGNVCRMKRMASNATRNKLYMTPTNRFVTNANNQSMNYSICSSNSDCGVVLPALEPDYGIFRIDKPRYFEDVHQAINCLFHTYKL